MTTKYKIDTSQLSVDGGTIRAISILTSSTSTWTTNSNLTTLTPSDLVGFGKDCLQLIDERHLNKLIDVLTCPIKNLSIYLIGECSYQRALAEKRYNQFQADLEEMKKELNKE